jgi:phosphoserine aminotransferase
MSSDIMSRPFDPKPFGLIYAGAQKNIGPSGTAMVIIRKDMLERTPENLPSMLKYTTFAGKNSMYNTPSCIVIYTVNLVLKWLEETVGGLEKMEQDQSGKRGFDLRFYRSVRFLQRDRGKGQPFFDECDLQTSQRGSGSEICGGRFEGRVGRLKGHRSVGGCRASIYNASGLDAVKALVIS